MNKSVAELSTGEFEQLVEQVIDRRMEVWLTQLIDALGTVGGEDEAEMQPEFTAGLKRSMKQAEAGQVIDLRAFRQQLGR